MSLVLLVGAAALGCQPDTTRPGFPPTPEAARAEIRLPRRDATLRLAESLRSDSVPTRLVHLHDGWFETGWFDARSGAVTRRRPVGPGVVRVRAWADPGRPGYTLLTVETVYRAVADPALPGRDLEREVARDHPAAARVQNALKALADRYGTPPVESAPATATPRDAPANDEAPPDEAPSEDTQERPEQSAE